MDFRKTYSVWTSYGMSSKFENEKNKRVKILNLYAIIWLHLILIFFITNLLAQGVSYFNGNSEVIINTADALMQGSLAVLLIPVILLNKNRHFKIARALFLSLAYINVLIYAVYIFPGNYTEYYFLINGGLSLSLFKKNTYPFILMIVSFLLFLTPYYIFDIYPSDYIERLLLSPTLRLFIMVYLLFNYFKRLNNRNEKLLILEKDKVLSDKIILQKQEAELRKLNEFKSHFFVNFSHEIRTPITLIKGYTSRIVSKDEENQQKLDIVNKQISNIEGILNSILDLSKIDANKLHLDKKHIALIPLIKKHYIDFAELFAKKEIDFSFEMDIPKLSIYSDEDFISKSLNNLLSNSLKFTPSKGKVKFKVTYKTNLIISIIDNGIGIPEEDLEKVFDRFYQSKNEINKSKGSGIGLAFTKSIIEAHGFAIKVTSQPNVATSFTITIPNEFIIEDIEFASTQINATYQDFKTNDKPIILIVDDYKQLRDYLKDVLKDYKILEAENGIEALKIVKKEKIDLLITDYMMPKMDGKELIENIKKAKINLSIIVLTARIDEFVKLKMLRIGVDGYLLKPFLEEELLLTVKKSLEAQHTILLERNTIPNKELIDFDNSNFSTEIAQEINKNIANSDFGVQDVAAYFEISKSTLNRRVKAILGQTTQQLILQARLKKARDLYLENPKMTQKEIALKVGMSNTSYLFKKLKENYGQQYV